MTKSESTSTAKSGSDRRKFLVATGAASGMLAMATSASGADEVVEINAMSPTPEQLQAYLAIDHDGPVVMVNLLKFKPDGGAEEYAKYAAGVQKLLKKIGAKVIFSGTAGACLIGNAEWDAVALVEYPNKMALLKMTQSDEYKAIHHHRKNGLDGQVNYAVIQKPIG